MGINGNSNLCVTGQYGSTLSVNNQQPGSYRNTPQASPMVQGDSNSGQGRSSTPPPGNSGNKSREDLAALDVQQLLSRHEELSTLRSCLHSFAPITLTLAQMISTGKSRNIISTKMPRFNNCRTPLPTRDSPNREPPWTIMNTPLDSRAWMAPSTTLHSTFEKTGKRCRCGSPLASIKMPQRRLQKR